MYEKNIFVFLGGNVFKKIVVDIIFPDYNFSAVLLCNLQLFNQAFD
jgi:hypothetical protein